MDKFRGGAIFLQTFLDKALEKYYPQKAKINVKSAKIIVPKGQGSGDLKYNMLWK